MPRFVNSQRLDVLGWLLHGAGVVVCGLVPVIVYSAVHRPLTESRTRLRGEIEQLDAVLRTADETARLHARLQRDHQAMHEELAAMLRRLPDTSQEAEFLAEVYGLAETVGIEIREFRPSAANHRDTCQEIKVRLSCVGGYAGLCRFLQQLDELPRLCRVTQLTISAEADGERYPMEISLSIFFAPHEPQPPEETPGNSARLAGETEAYQ